MPNRNYINGRGKEQRIAAKERKAGHVAIRSAGSKGNFDVVVIDSEKREIRLYQCKPASARKADGSLRASFERLEEDLTAFEGVYTVKIIIATTGKYTKSPVEIDPL